MEQNDWLACNTSLDSLADSYDVVSRPSDDEESSIDDFETQSILSASSSAGLDDFTHVSEHENEEEEPSTPSDSFSRPTSRQQQSRSERSTLWTLDNLMGMDSFRTSMLLDAELAQRINSSADNGDGANGGGGGPGGGDDGELPAITSLANSNSTLRMPVVRSDTMTDEKANRFLHRLYDNDYDVELRTLDIACLEDLSILVNWFRSVYPGVKKGSKLHLLGFGEDSDEIRLIMDRVHLLMMAFDNSKFDMKHFYVEPTYNSKTGKPHTIYRVPHTFETPTGTNHYFYPRSKCEQELDLKNIDAIAIVYYSTLSGKTSVSPRWVLDLLAGTDIPLLPVCDRLLSSLDSGPEADVLSSLCAPHVIRTIDDRKLAVPITEDMLFARDSSWILGSKLCEMATVRLIADRKPRLLRQTNLDCSESLKTIVTGGDSNSNFLRSAWFIFHQYSSFILLFVTLFAMAIPYFVLPPYKAAVEVVDRTDGPFPGVNVSTIDLSTSQPGIVHSAVEPTYVITTPIQSVMPTISSSSTPPSISDTPSSGPVMGRHGSRLITVKDATKSGNCRKGRKKPSKCRQCAQTEAEQDNAPSSISNEATTRTVCTDKRYDIFRQGEDWDQFLKRIQKRAKHIVDDDWKPKLSSADNVTRSLILHLDTAVRNLHPLEMSQQMLEEIMALFSGFPDLRQQMAGQMGHIWASVSNVSREMASYVQQINWTEQWQSAARASKQLASRVRNRSDLPGKWQSARVSLEETARKARIGQQRIYRYTTETLTPEMQRRASQVKKEMDERLYQAHNHFTHAQRQAFSILARRNQYYAEMKQRLNQFRTRDRFYNSDWSLFKRERQNRDRPTGHFRRFRRRFFEADEPRDRNQLLFRLFGQDWYLVV